MTNNPQCEASNKGKYKETEKIRSCWENMKKKKKIPQKIIIIIQETQSIFPNEKPQKGKSRNGEASRRSSDSRPQKHQNSNVGSERKHHSQQKQEKTK